jgi:drug/metabolite transporter (DMT)-like permease
VEPVGHIISVREDRTRRRGRVKPRDVGLLLALGAMWGSSFLFIKVAVAEVEPAFVVVCRLFFALLALMAALPLLGRLSEERITAHALLGLLLILLGVAGVSGIARRKPSEGTP